MVSSPWCSMGLLATGCLDSAGGRVTPGGAGPGPILDHDRSGCPRRMTTRLERGAAKCSGSPRASTAVSPSSASITLRRPSAAVTTTGQTSPRRADPATFRRTPSHCSRSCCTGPAGSPRERCDRGRRACVRGGSTPPRRACSCRRPRPSPGRRRSGRCRRARQAPRRGRGPACGSRRGGSTCGLRRV
jgi:hypothetical protein